MNMEDTADLKIEAVWMNVYQGATYPARTEDHTFYIDVVAIGRGPSVRRRTESGALPHAGKEGADERGDPSV